MEALQTNKRSNRQTEEKQVGINRISGRERTGRTTREQSHRRDTETGKRQKENQWET